MAQIQFRSDDTTKWAERFGNASFGAASINTSTDATANTTFSATSGSTSATVGSGTGFAAGDLILIHQSRNGGGGVGNWQLNKIVSVGGGTNWTLTYPTVLAFDTTAQVCLLRQHSSYTVNSGQTLTASAWDGTKGGIIAVLCNGPIVIDGTITAQGKGFRGGNNGNNVGSYNAECGEGTGGARVTGQISANGNGGGSGATNLGQPGAGGNGQAGQGGGNGPGNVVGNAGLTLMNLGGASGGISRDSPGAGEIGANGGAIIILIGKSITINGSMNLNGNNSTSTNNSGGAGGSALLKGQIISIGTNLITASGGTGTRTGGYGYVHADYSASFSGSSTPTVDYRQDSTLRSPNAAGILGIMD